MATRNQSDSIRQELNGTWQPISGSFNFSYTSIAGFPRLLLHHDGSLYVLAGTGAILWLKPEYQINGGAWTDSGWGPDGGKFTFPAGWDGTISLHCNRPCFPADYPAGTVINTRVMAKCSGSVVLCDSLLDPYPDVSKTWVQADSHQWNDAEDDVVIPLWGPFPDTGQTIQVLAGDDADYGWDATDNDPADGLAGFSYTKLDAAGNELPPGAESWEFTRDNRSGLIYRFNGSVTASWDEAMAAAAAYGELGESWRLPRVTELVFLANYWKAGGVIDPMVAAISSGFPFSGTEYTGTTNVWSISLSDGHTDKAISKSSSTRPQFFVAGTQLVASFTDNGDGTITDAGTGLMWSKEPTAAVSGWSEAISAANDSTLAGYEDWRLPNIKELHTLIDFAGAQNTSAVPAPFVIPDQTYVWTSTTHFANINNAWFILFHDSIGGRGWMPSPLFPKTQTGLRALFVRNV